MHRCRNAGMQKFFRANQARFRQWHKSRSVFSDHSAVHLFPFTLDPKLVNGPHLPMRGRSTAKMYTDVYRAGVIQNIAKVETGSSVCVGHKFATSYVILFSMMSSLPIRSGVSLPQVLLCCRHSSGQRPAPPFLSVPGEVRCHVSNLIYHTLWTAITL